MPNSASLPRLSHTLLFSLESISFKSLHTFYSTPRTVPGSPNARYALIDNAEMSIAQEWIEDIIPKLLPQLVNWQNYEKSLKLHNDKPSVDASKSSSLTSSSPASSSTSANSCNVCDKPSTNKCARCKQVYYCGRDHQVSDHRNHREYCKLIQNDLTSELDHSFHRVFPLFLEGLMLVADNPLVYPSDSMIIAKNHRLLMLNKATQNLETLDQRIASMKTFKQHAAAAAAAAHAAHSSSSSSSHAGQPSILDPFASSCSLLSSFMSVASIIAVSRTCRRYRDYSYVLYETEHHRWYSLRRLTVTEFEGADEKFNDTLELFRMTRARKYSMLYGVAMLSAHYDSDMNLVYDSKIELQRQSVVNAVSRPVNDARFVHDCVSAVFLNSDRSIPDALKSNCIVLHAATASDKTSRVFMWLASEQVPQYLVTVDARVEMMRQQKRQEIDDVESDKAR